MPSRDWDKIRRNARVGRYSAIDSFRPPSSYRRRYPARPKPARVHRPRNIIRLPSPTTPKGLVKILVVTGPDWSAPATWRNCRRGWRCVETSAQLRWMSGMNPAQAQRTLSDRRLAYEWHDPVNSLAPARTFRNADCQPEPREVVV